MVTPQPTLEVTVYFTRSTLQTQNHITLIAIVIGLSANSINTVVRVEVGTRFSTLVQICIGNYMDSSAIWE